mgnify:CR=1 FL=1
MAKLTVNQIEDLAAADIKSGEMADARISESSVTQHQAALSITESQISDLGDYQPRATALTNTTAAFTTEQQTKLSNIETGATADQVASEVPVTPTGNLAANNAQSAFAELQGDIDTINSSLGGLTDIVALKGTWDASAGSFPGSGSAQAGWSYIVSVAGTVDGTPFGINDRILAVANNASTSTYASNWHKLDYTDEVLSVNSKTGAVTLNPDDLDDAATTNKFTSADDISKLAGIASGATANDTDANLKNRANHTGTQTASTISDFDVEVANNSAVAANTAKVSYTDAVKVAGIESGADVTDAANVAAAGALMLSTGGTLVENAPIALDPTLSADGKYSGVTDSGTAGETIAFGDVVYFKASDSKWWKTDADATATAGAVKIAICVAGASADAATTLLLFGNIRADAKFPTFTISAPIYLSGTAGLLTNTAPSGTDKVVRIVGHAKTADAIYWNPSNDFITLT